MSKIRNMLVLDYVIKRLFPHTTSSIKLVRDAAGLKSKFAALIFVLSKNVYRLLSRLKIIKTWEIVPSLLPSDIIVKNEDGVFYCRRGTEDIYIIDPEFEKPLRSYFDLKKGVFLDVGAHIGKYTIMVGRKLIEGKIIAIEPEPGNFEILRKNVSLNRLNNVTALNIAASDKDDMITFYKIKGPHTGWHSTIKPRWDYEEIKVEARRLSSVLQSLGVKQIDLLKIDVEGAERLVLEGLGTKLYDVKKIIYEATHSTGCEQLLTTYGFKIPKTFVFDGSVYKLAIRGNRVNGEN